MRQCREPLTLLDTTFFCVEPEGHQCVHFYRFLESDVRRFAERATRAEADAAALRAKAKTFPVIYKRNDVAGPTHIPWSVADMAYSVYSARYGKNQTLERMAERGGLYAEELDEFLPGWREQSSEVTQLRADIAALRAALAESCDERRTFLLHELGRPCPAEADAAALRALLEPITDLHGWGLLIKAPIVHLQSCAFVTKDDGTEWRAEDADCTCGYEWRIRTSDYMTAYNAWRKRAEESEKNCADLRARAAELGDKCE